MAMGRRKNRERQEELWIAANAIVETPGHAFYEGLNELLADHGFDRVIERLCRRYYRGPKGRPSMAPGVYFRMLLIGYFEGLDSERGIAWRVADSLSLRKFLGYGVDERTPDHSTVSRTRRLFWLSTHRAVFHWVLGLVAGARLLGTTTAVDATALEANAAMRSIVRRDSGLGYEAYLQELATAAGLENPTREELARFDRKRKKKTSNKEWRHPHDPDARISKLKDGRTRMAHKVEHAVDLPSGAVVAITVQPADAGDTSTLGETVKSAQQSMERIDAPAIKDVVTDKGYHSDDVLGAMQEQGIRTYISEPDRGRRRWQGKQEEQARLYANRRRASGQRGRRLHKKRAEVGERTFAHMYETGGMRRLYLRGRKNIEKRLLIHAAGLNLSLIMRRRYGNGKPKARQGISTPIADALGALYATQAAIGRVTRATFEAATAVTADFRLVRALPVAAS